MTLGRLRLALALAWATIASTVVAGCGDLLAPAPAHSPSAPAVVVAEDLAGARALDQQGVLAFEAGRYRDALTYFDAAFARGGPPSERWNAAKCHLKLDDPEAAESALDAYLGFAGLSADDRREGAAALEALRKRPANVTVLSTPPGLPIVIDGRKIGVTPVSQVVLAGEHLLVVERGGGARDERTFSTKLGRALVIEARP